MLCSSAAPVFAANENTAADADDIVVLYTNDIHCTNDEGMAYAAIAGYKAQMEDAIGADNVTLVDNGDAIQGAPAQAPRLAIRRLTTGLSTDSRAPGAGGAPRRSAARRAPGLGSGSAA